MAGLGHYDPRAACTSEVAGFDRSGWGESCHRLEQALLGEQPMPGTYESLHLKSSYSVCTAEHNLNLSTHVRGMYVVARKTTRLERLL